MNDSQNESSTFSDSPTRENIRKITSAFDAAWKSRTAGSAEPKVEDFLETVSDPHREFMRTELEKIAGSYRSKSTQDAALQKTYIPKDSPGDSPESKDPGNAETVIGAVETDETLTYIGQSSEKQDGPDYKLGMAGVTSPPGYEILEELGRGGMGVVYRARQAALKRMVALKMILSGDHSSSEELLRFRDEAEAVAQLQHPNIVQIHDIGEMSGLPYFSLEFVDGITLQQKAGGEPLPVEEAAQMVETLARAMQYAHQMNVVHRDLKPGNVLLTKEGVPKIADFGLAKRLDIDSSRTRTGTIVGTPKYMAPEQAQGGKNIGPLTDVYSLGAILYELLTGRAPFLAATPMETVMLVLDTEPVPPARLRPNLSRDIVTICLKCLQKDPGKRYDDAEALAEDLRRFQAGEPIMARPVSDTERFWRWCKRKPAIASSIAVSILLLLTVTFGSWAAAISINIEKNKAENSRAKALQKAIDEVIARKEAEVAKKSAEDAKIIAEDAEKKAKESAQLASKRLIQTLDALKTLVYEVQGQLSNRPSMQSLKTALLKTAIDGLNKVTKNAGVSSEADLFLAGAHRRMGEIYLELGQTDQALKEFQQCHKIAEELHQQGKLTRVQENMAMSLNNLGNATQKLGDTQKAREYFLQALAQREEFLANNRGNKQKEFSIPIDHISDSHHRLGRLALQEGNLQEALERYIKLHEIRTHWVKSSPNNEDAQQALAGSYMALGGVYQRIGDFEKAYEYINLALPLFESFAERNRGFLSNRVNVAVTVLRLAHLRLWMRDFQAARSSYERAKDLLEELYREDSLNAKIKRNLALSYSGLGITSENLNLPEAESFHNKALELQKELHEVLKNDDTGRAELMHAYARAGFYQKAIEFARELEEEHSENSHILMQVAAGYSLCVSAVARRKAENQLTDDDKKLQEQFGSKAVEIIRICILLGYNSLANLESDPDLDPIRGRDDFVELFNELKKAESSN